jgi:hypothetical protein
MGFRGTTVAFLGVLGSVIVYSLMMAFGDPGLELVICGAWLPVYLAAYARTVRPDAPAAADAPA